MDGAAPVSRSALGGAGGEPVDAGDDDAAVAVGGKQGGRGGEAAESVAGAGGKEGGERDYEE